MKLASHNTFSYLPVRQWWLRPFAFVGRCQRVNIYEQLLHGARMFDLRVRFRNMKPVICHGLLEYDMSDESLRAILKDLNDNFPVWIRAVLESKNPDLEQRVGFDFFCMKLEREYPNLFFFGGNDRSDWECKFPLYRFNNDMPDIEHLYASATQTSRIDDIWPIRYAKKYNKDNVSHGTDKPWMMIDFLDIT